jgi:hypothetical protein
MATATVPKDPAPRCSCSCSQAVTTQCTASEADELLWTSIECNAAKQKAVRVIGAMTREEAEGMTEEQYEALVESATKASADRADV